MIYPSSSRRSTFLISAIVCFTFATDFAAATPPQPTQLKPLTQSNPLVQQRDHYQKAKTALAKNDLVTYRAYFSKLGDYPLKPYLEFTELKKRLSTATQTDINRFLAEYPDAYLSNQLRTQYLGLLAHRQLWPDYLRYYQTSDGKSSDFYCHSLTARQLAKDTTANQEVADLWQQGKPLSTACENTFALWRKAGHLTQDLIWSRLNNAMDLGQTGLAKNMVLQSVKYRPQADLYWQVASSPKLVLQQSKFLNKDVHVQQALGYGIRRLAIANPLEALKTWYNYEQKITFAPEVASQVKMHLATHLIKVNQIELAKKLLKNSYYLQNEDQLDQILRDMLAVNNWSGLAETLPLLNNESKQNERWAYWAARTQEVLRKPIPGFNDPATIYREVSKNRSFYGFLASDKLGQAYSLLDETQPVDQATLTEVVQLPVIKRIQELRMTENLVDARAEWMFASRTLSPRQLSAASQLIQSWGWYTTGIQTMVANNRWNDLTIRFPLAYQNEIFKAAETQKLEPTLVYAIARQESAFDAQAKSRAGALGLMQIMPQTAVYTAKMAGVVHNGANDLLNPVHNTRLGTHYLNYLLTKFDSNRILAAAAYNAGPNRVNKWLNPEGTKQPADVWVETIPIKETRNYVQNILCFSVIYAYRLGKPAYFLSGQEAKQFL